MADRGLIILLILVIIVAGGILGFRRYMDLNAETEMATQEAVQNGGTVLEANTFTTSGVTDKTDEFLNMGIGENDVEKFNNNFIKYQGAQSGTMVRLLINAVRDSNAASTHQISMEYNDKTYTEDVSNIRSLISLNNTYTISFEYNSTTQYIEKIIIK